MLTYEQEVEAVPIENVNKELKFAFAKLQLAKYEPNVLGVPLTGSQGFLTPTKSCTTLFVVL